jgi:ankyrin repeat protein
LLNRRCNTIDDENVNGLRPLHLAALTGKSNFMRYLIDKGAKPIVNDLALGAEELAKLPEWALLGPTHAHATTSADTTHEISDAKTQENSVINEKL